MTGIVAIFVLLAVFWTAVGAFVRADQDGLEGALAQPAAPRSGIIPGRLPAYHAKQRRTWVRPASPPGSSGRFGGLRC